MMYCGTTNNIDIRCSKSLAKKSKKFHMCFVIDQKARHINDLNDIRSHKNLAIFKVKSLLFICCNKHYFQRQKVERCP